MKGDGVALGPGGEFDLIRQLKQRWGPLAPNIGDDAAVLRPPHGEQLVVTTDAALEDVHFRRAWLSLQEIGYRAVTAALSDLAAMAAAPLGVLISLELSPDARDGLMQLADGIADAVRAVDTVVLGGNLAHGDTLAITTTAVGSAYAPLPRHGARPGDLLYVTGSLGGPRAAIEALDAGIALSVPLRERFAHPVARIHEARWLAARGAVSGIDISDGLTSDAGHLAAASDVTLEIQVERVPVMAGATEDAALAGGDEYELLVVARAPLPEDEFARRFHVPLTLIGRAVEGVSGVGGVGRVGRVGDAAVRLTRAGKRVAAPPGYDHFSR